MVHPGVLVGAHPHRPARGSSNPSSRSSTSPSITRISRRARLAPRQKWVRCPKVRWGLGSRLMSNRNGSVEDQFVPIGRRPPQGDLVAGGDGLAAQLGGPGGRPPVVEGGGGPPQDLLHRRRASANGRPGGRPAGRGARSAPPCPGRWSCGWSRCPATTSRLKNISSSRSARGRVPPPSSSIRAWAATEIIPSSGRRPLVGDEPAPVGGHRRRRGGDLVAGLPELAALVVEGRVGPRHQVVPVLLGHPHQRRHRLERELGRHLGRGSRTIPARRWRPRCAGPARPAPPPSGPGPGAPPRG